MREEELHRFYESAVRYLLKDMDSQEQTVFENELHGDVELKHLFFRIKDVWEYHQLKAESDKIDLNQVWEEMTRQDLSRTSYNVRVAKKVSILSRGLQVAASIIILLGIGWMMNVWLGEKQTSNLVNVFECPKGDQVKMTLADGSVVWLNSDSKLTLPQKFSAKYRQLTLEGEAFFNVHSDSLHPFIVDVAQHQVRVTGTQFNVRYYPEEKLFQTTLNEGKVAVSKGKQLIHLKPGEQLNINTESGEVRIDKGIKTEQFSAWREGRFEFDNMSMRELMNNVERWYGHEIIVNDSELMDLRFSGVLKHNKSIEHFMEVLSISHPIKYKILEDTIIVEPIGKKRSKRMR